MEKRIDAAALAHLETKARTIGELIARAVRNTESGEEWGFALLLFRFASPETTYIANADRAAMIRVLRETADKIEAETGPPPSIV